jgi:hypothetical protein
MMPMSILGIPIPRPTPRAILSLRLRGPLLSFKVLELGDVVTGWGEVVGVWLDVVVLPELEEPTVVVAILVDEAVAALQ